MIVGFSIDVIDAKRNDGIVVKRGEEINVNTTPTITDVEVVDVLGKKDTVKFSYTFDCKYTPDLGSIRFEGNLLWRGNDEKDIKKIADSWKEKNYLHPEAALEVMNTIFRRCLSRAITLTDELRLPPPLQFPIVKLNEDVKKAKVQKNDE